MNELDMAILREWAEAKVSRRRFATDYDLEVARHILGTTPAPTMADVEWDDAVHVGQCAEHPTYEAVRMLGLDWENDHAERILCYLRPGVLYSLPMSSLTPLPGTRLDITPRSHSEG